tara:strand:+ start:286 stop:876 length:591 start_codon:yes stop_codon:yes gene_type:complete
MDKKRKAYAPFSLTSEAGVAQTPVEGYIDVNQTVYPTVTTGEINENGKWIGVKSNDSQFIGLTRYVSIADGGEVLGPDTNNNPSIDMTGFTDLFIAIKPDSSSTTLKVEAVRGPDTIRFANLDPVSTGELLRGNLLGQDMDNFNNVLVDTAETYPADVWTITIIQNVLKNQQNVQFKLTNNSTGTRSFEFAFMRLV